MTLGVSKCTTILNDVVTTISCDLWPGLERGPRGRDCSSLVRICEGQNPALTVECSEFQTPIGHLLSAFDDKIYDLNALFCAY